MKMSNMSVAELDVALDKLKSDGLIEYNEYIIKIKSRRQFLDYVYDKLETR